MAGRWYLGFALALLSGAAVGGWDAVGSGDGMTVYADRSTIQKTTDEVRMWALLDYRADQKDDTGKTFRSAKLLHAYDCSGERAHTLYYSLHAGQMAAGVLVYSEARQGSEWRPARREVIGETLWKIACGKS
jgi:hypothetical protein